MPRVKYKRETLGQFKERLEAEGRMQQWLQRARTIQSEKGCPIAVAKAAARLEFPPLWVKDPKAGREAAGIPEPANPESPADVEEAAQALHRRSEERMSLAHPLGTASKGEFLDREDMGMADVILWVLEHVDIDDVTVADVPCRAALTLLNYARQDQTTRAAFLERLASLNLRASLQEGIEGKRREDDGRRLDDLLEVLSFVGDGLETAVRGADSQDVPREPDVAAADSDPGGGEPADSG